jgi:phosphatidylglycerophosphate synthase
MQWKKEWIYLPNLIGYARIYLLVLFFVAKEPMHQALFMTINLLLDVLDGKIARKLNQCTLFGARLDLIIDMLSLSLLSFYLAALSSVGWISCLFVLCGVNDAISYMLSIATFYGKKTPEQSDHKDALKQKGYLLPLYYSASGLALSNVLHDAYLLSPIYTPPFIPSFIIYLCLAGCLFRQLCVAEQTYHLLQWRREIAKKTA